MAYRPRRPTGNNAAAIFMQAVWDHVFGPDGQFNSTTTVKVNRTSKGYFFDAAPQTPGSSQLLLYKITTLSQADYFGATKWNPTVDNGDGTFGATTGSEVTVAKCLSGRRPPSEYLNGAKVTYAYTAENARVATPGGAQTLFPAYANDNLNVTNGILAPPGLVLVSRVANGTGVFDADGNELKLIEVQPCRLWSVPQGGGGSTKFTLTGVAGDYITATDTTGAAVNIAKNQFLRTSIASHVIDGVVWSYAYTDATRRTASSAASGKSYFQRVSPRYIVGSIIFADQPTGGTGVSVSGVALTWCDTNRDGRAWTNRQDQTGP